VEAEAEELHGMRYWDGRAADLEGGKGNLNFFFLNITTFD